MQDHCIELLLSSPQRADRDVRELTTFRYRLTLLCRVGLPRGPSPPWPSTSFSRKTISNLQSQYRKATCLTVKAGRLVKDFNLREDVRHKHENNRHFYLRFDTTHAGERSFFRNNRWFFPRENDNFFATFTFLYLLIEI